MTRTTMVHAADLHGRLPQRIPKCDIFTISGDVCRNFSGNVDTDILAQAAWLRSVFAPWLRSQPVGWTLATWGNHDALGYLAQHYISCEVPVFWLVDRLKQYQGFNFYGCPWTRLFGEHGYYMVESENQLAHKYAGIQPCDVLLSHGPPLGLGDLAPAAPAMQRYEVEHVGSQSLYDRIAQVRPKLTVCGHIHPGNGLYWIDDLPVANVAVADPQYNPTQRMLKTTWEGTKLVDLEPVDP